MPKVKVIGAGLAGSEAAYQLAKRGVDVELYEMRPGKMTPAHSTSAFAELVCSNSLKSLDSASAAGTLKYELLALDSLLIGEAIEASVPAGKALAVDREAFSKRVTEAIASLPNVNVVEKELEEIPDGPAIIAT
ncbi:MAG: FAD-dependent oxidoreductase, partial [Coriobacteriales bacterium]|nr:FAD-dependent oxidoreductase [Coriobacteriales bacterium]